MNIIFISATCTRSDYEEICKKRKYPLLDSSQKFFEMFLNGLSQQENVIVDCITVRPISHSTYPGFYIPGSKTQSNNICYHYAPIWNFPVVKSLFATCAVREKLQQLIREYTGNDIRIICDPLLLEGLLPTVQLGRKHGIMTAGFLTDMPDFADECDQHGKLKSTMYWIYNKIINKNMRVLDRYVVLTEAMRCVADEKPWLLLDCIVDERMLTGLLPEVYEDNRPHILYAGKLHKEFGLDLLGQTMQLVKSDCVFDIYGDGNYYDALCEIAQKQANVKLHGIVPLKQVLCAELAASVLVNPRTSVGVFTKYSFPSKTAEYMLSGIPTVMFRLPGMSPQYNEYIYFADEETPESLAAQIDNVLSMSIEAQRNAGMKAKQFVVENKKNTTQAKRVIDFLKKD